MENNDEMATAPDVRKGAAGGMAADQKDNTSSGKNGALSPAAESLARREKAAVSMADELGSLQEIASRHGFNFLVYMLDIARAEAESLQHDLPRPDSENSIDSD